jgi:hypothetical protein
MPEVSSGTVQLLMSLQGRENYIFCYIVCPWGGVRFVPIIGDGGALSSVSKIGGRSMEHDVKPAPEHPELHPVQAYEPPRIEVVLTPEALGREGLYAGITPSPTL